ncbi:MAG TPA: LysR substrate-binding domain-containing protein [Pseudonocardia sp.]|nr:LysR substrate-binding domain-containing protein [Pseudonocardia sp.]
MDLELRHLRRLVEIADAGDLPTAARALGMPASRLAAQLARFESQLGGPVFVRTPAGLMPTERGREVLGLARDVLADITDLQAEARRGRSVELRLVGADFLLAPTIVGFAGSNPHVVVTSRTADLHAAVEALRIGSADVAVTVRWPHAAWPLPESTSDIQVREIARHPMRVLLPDTHRLAESEVVDLAALAEEVWCARSEPALAATVSAECVRFGFEPDIRYRLGDDGAIAELVAAGRAVTVTAHPQRPRAGVVSRPYRDATQCGWLVAWRDGSAPSELVSELVSVVRDWHARRAWPTLGGSGLHSLGSAERELRIGSEPELAGIAQLPRLRTVHGLHCTVSAASHEEVVEGVSGGRLDLALCFEYPFLPDRSRREFARRVVAEDQPFYVAVSPHHSWSGDPVPLTALAGEAWAVRRSGDQVQVLRALCRAAGFEPRIETTFEDTRDVTLEVTAGRLVRLAEPTEPATGPVFVRLDHPMARRTSVLMWTPDDATGLVADLVAEELRLAATATSFAAAHTYNQ